MRILLLHNRYQQSGGEDVVVHTDKALLEANSHDLIYKYRTRLSVKKFHIST